MRFSTLMMAAALLGPGLVAHAQDKPYKVDFTIRDTGDAGGKTGRKYSMLVSPSHKTTFKVGNRVPVATGSGTLLPQRLGELGLCRVSFRRDVSMLHPRNGTIKI